MHRILQDAERADNAHWLPGARLNIAECALRNRGDDAAPAVLVAGEGSPTDVRRLSRGQLRQRAVAVACGLRAMGLRPGAHLPGQHRGMPARRSPHCGLQGPAASPTARLTAWERR